VLGLGSNLERQHKSDISDVVHSFAWQSRTNQVCARGKLGMGAAIVQSTDRPPSPQPSPRRGEGTDRVSRKVIDSHNARSPQRPRQGSMLLLRSSAAFSGAIANAWKAFATSCCFETAMTPSENNT